MFHVFYGLPEMDFSLLGYYLGHEVFLDRNIYIHLDTDLVLPASKVIFTLSENIVRNIHG